MLSGPTLGSNVAYMYVLNAARISYVERITVLTKRKAVPCGAPLNSFSLGYERGLGRDHTWVA